MAAGSQSCSARDLQHPTFSECHGLVPWIVTLVATRRLPRAQDIPCFCSTSAGNSPHWWSKNKDSGALFM